MSHKHRLHYDEEHDRVTCKGCEFVWNRELALAEPQRMRMPGVRYHPNETSMSIPAHLINFTATHS